MAIAIQPPAKTDRGIDDVVILGGGLAGLFCALQLAPRPVTILTAAPIGQGASSTWAQGGIAAAVSEGDSPSMHLADTIAAGAGLVQEKIAELMTREAADRIEDLLRYGVPFDKDLEGKLVLGREAAHSERRIVKVRGDMAGAAIMQALIATVRNTPSIRVLEGFVGESLTTDGKSVTGILARPAGGQAFSPVLFPARAIVIASGGIGHLYAVTTNPVEANGQGIAMAARAGAILADCEFVQFHPTAIDIGRDPAPLATEALRGEGAWLVNADGRRFMPDYHAGAELAPRDVVARAVHAERMAGRGAFLDARKAVGAAFADKFPTVFATCQSAGIDPVTGVIPVAPAEHYHMGGILTDANGRTSLDGLWAAGEAASTGVHGANRLASNSLLEAVVFAARIAADIHGLMPSPRNARWQLVDERVAGDDDAEFAFGVNPDPVATLRRTMADHVGVIRSREGLATALATIAALRVQAKSADLINMLTAAKIIAAAAWRRQESRGGHYRSDFPQSVEALRLRSFLTLRDADRIALEAGMVRRAAA